MTVLDSAIWGFLSNCLSGDALVIFQQAADLAGFDAWRRLMRLIDSGRAIRLEQIRNEVRLIRAHPIKNLEGVAVGVAAFENKIQEFVEAGGRQPPDEEMKSDLNAILPAEVADHLTVRVTDRQQPYIAFKEFVVHTCAQLLMRKRRPLNIVGDDEGGGAGAGEEGQYYDDNKDEDYQWLIAALRKGKGKGRFGGGKNEKAQKAGRLVTTQTGESTL